jgi:hypothetical protein
MANQPEISSPAGAAEPAIPQDVAVVIAAAVTAALGRDARIKRIRYRRLGLTKEWYMHGRAAMMMTRTPPRR